MAAGVSIFPSSGQGFLLCYTVLMYCCMLGVMRQLTCVCWALHHEELHPDPTLQAVHAQIPGWELGTGTGWNFGVVFPRGRTFEALGEWSTQTFGWPKGQTGNETANWPLMVMISFFYLGTWKSRGKKRQYFIIFLKAMFGQVTDQ